MAMRHLERYQLVILRRPADAPDLPDDELDRLQLAHLAHKDRLYDAGILVANGPTLDPDDPSIRGFSVYRTSGVDEARRLAEEDPSVIAGRLSVEVMTWLTRPGSMRLPGDPISLPEN